VYQVGINKGIILRCTAYHISRLDNWLTVHRSVTLVDLQLDAQSHLQTVTIPEAAYIQIRHGPPQDEKGNARNMKRILINVLYVNK